MNDEEGRHRQMYFMSLKVISISLCTTTIVDFNGQLPIVTAKGRPETFYPARVPCIHFNEGERGRSRRRGR